MILSRINTPGFSYKSNILRLSLKATEQPHSIKTWSCEVFTKQTKNAFLWTFTWSSMKLNIKFLKIGHSPIFFEFCSFNFKKIQVMLYDFDELSRSLSCLHISTYTFLLNMGMTAISNSIETLCADIRTYESSVVSRNCSPVRKSQSMDKIN